MPKKTYSQIDDGGKYVTVKPQTELDVKLLNRQLDRIQSFMPTQKHRVTPTKLTKRLVMEQAGRDKNETS